MVLKLKESAVGQVGRTGKIDAINFVKENPEIIKKFKKIVSDIGGKAVAAQILNLNLFGSVSKKPLSKYKLKKHMGGEKL